MYKIIFLIVIFCSTSTFAQSSKTTPMGDYKVKISVEANEVIIAFLTKANKSTTISSHGNGSVVAIPDKGKILHQKITPGKNLKGFSLEKKSTSNIKKVKFKLEINNISRSIEVDF